MKILNELKVFVFIMAFFFLHDNFSKAADTSSVKYFPLKVGNSYTYKYSNNDSISYYKAEIIKDSIFNGRKYYYCINFPFVKEVQSFWLRTDTITGSLYRYNPVDFCGQFYFREDLVDTLSAEFGGSFRDCHTLINMYVNYIGNDSLFGQTHLKKNFHYQTGGMFFNVIYDKSYEKYIGLTKYIYDYHYFGGGSTLIIHSLIGCVINGIVYGDTSTIVNINTISTQVPGGFLLYQNYPNPFNPHTKIRFDIPSPAFVTVNIYNSLGELLENPVNQKFDPGIYETIFDGSQYSSGVYFYTIQSGEFKKTMRMMLIK